MANSRRTNLRESLVELRQRHFARQHQVSRISEKKIRQNEARKVAPPREDERLMNASVTRAMKELQTGAVPDPGREERIAEMRERFAAKESAKAELRKDALHTLYMNAREFIVTEAQLNAKIDEIFTEKPYPNNPGATSVWEAFGSPETIQNLLTTVNNTEKTAVDFHVSPAVKTGRRLKKIAEELTGGKMD